MSKMRLRSFEKAPGQRHVSEVDRYLYRREEPKFRLVVIGTGTMGQEHMRVAALLGRAHIHGIYDSHIEGRGGSKLSAPCRSHWCVMTIWLRPVMTPRRMP